MKGSPQTMHVASEATMLEPLGPYVESCVFALDSLQEHGHFLVAGAGTIPGSVHCECQRVARERVVDELPREF
jgi:hypothetical protein